MNRLRFGVCEDKLMVEQTKVAIRCIQKRCQGIRCSISREHSKDISGLMKSLMKGTVDVVALSYNDAVTYLAQSADSIMLAARIKNVDDRYVLMTKKKSGKHFANALVSSPGGNVGAQLQQMFDGVICVETEETLEERIDRLLLDKCDGVLAKASDVINLGFSRTRGIRYKYFEADTLVPDSGDDVIAVLCKKDSAIAESLIEADNKRVSKQIAIQKLVLQYIADGNLASDCQISVRANIKKEQLYINLYLNKDGEGRYFRRNGKYSERKQMIVDIGKDVQSHMQNSNVF